MATAAPPVIRWNQTADELIVDEFALRLHVGYSYLPVLQQAEILWAIAGLHRAVLSLSRDPSLAVVSLGIDQVSTGQSVDWKFGGRVPKIVISKAGDLEIWMPRWAVGLIVAGALLKATASVLNDVEDIFKVAQEHRPEIIQLARQAYDLHRLFEPHDARTAEVQRQLARFRHEIDSPNILLVELNGLTIRRREEEEGEGDQPARR
jgi:hypothetical protein